MSFGFSVGDFISATRLATDTLSSLLAAQDEPNQDSVIILSFRSLQAQRIKELQQELYRISLDRVRALQSPAPVAGAQVDDEESPLRDINARLDLLLNNYGWLASLPVNGMTNETAAEAIRNYETLSQESVDFKTFFDDGTILSIYRRMFGLSNPYHSLVNILPKEPNLGLNLRELNKDIREAKMRKQAFSERIWMGALGGIAVIGPMLLMTLRRDLVTSLVTSSVATVLFTLVLALGARNLKGQEVLGAVAAYAAVLVVFIGTSIPPVS